jgi:pyruvate ferredoxin oxidoreductase gamma subunit
MHGRGGQGIKTASQILGTAAYNAGFQAQDFPLYGAERRGAPIVAYARINQDPILERGAILYPDILLIGDETLLEDPIAAPLTGADTSTLLYINSTHTPEQLKDHFKLASLPVQEDVTELCQQFLQNRNILSTALSAVAARLLDISLEHLEEAIHMELGEEKISAQKLEDNLKLVREIYKRIQPVALPEKSEEPELKPTHLAELQPKSVVEGGPIIFDAANMGLRKTGNWRTQRPDIDYEVCNHCGICYLRCPEGDIRLDADGKPVIDYDHCKGCLICAAECPKHAIHARREVTSWN